MNKALYRSGRICRSTSGSCGSSRKYGGCTGRACRIPIFHQYFSRWKHLIFSRGVCLWRTVIHSDSDNEDVSSGMSHIPAIICNVCSDACLRVVAIKNEMTSSILALDPAGVATTFLARSVEKYQMPIRKSCRGMAIVAPRQCERAVCMRKARKL